jgi:hypothetical protein
MWDQQGQWELAVLTVRSATTVPTETLEYDRLLIRTEMVSARVAGDRLRAGDHGLGPDSAGGPGFSPGGDRTAGLGHD